MHYIEKFIKNYIESNYMGFKNDHYKSFGKISKPIEYKPPYIATTNFTIDEIE